MDTNEFYLNLRQDILMRSDVQEGFSESLFAELVSEHLLDTGDIEDFNLCPYKQRGIKLDGYALLEDKGTLDLFVVDYRDVEEPETLIKTELAQIFRRVEAFMERCLEDGFLDALETSLPIYGLVERIHANRDDLSQVRVFLFTNANLSGSIRELPPQRIAGREWSYRIWDLERLERVMGAGEPEPIVVDFKEMFGSCLDCLPAGENAEGLRSYLAVIPGDWLAKIYDRYSGRLMEQNVRTFLQLKTGINKGIRKTILETPQLFFPYNNGISATAEEAEIETEGGGLRIRKLRNFQIVNGGQTTASLHYSMKKDGAKASLDRIRVQVKLTVVAPEQIGELIPKISRYANTQNKVSEADFFSNHLFHVRIEGFSRRIWAPPAKGAVYQTHWFYERARGQFINEQAHLTEAARKNFLGGNPRSQLVTKTDLAKYINTFELIPDRVSQGAQKNFGEFAKSVVAPSWEKDDKTFSESWFQDAMAKAIIFRASEKLVQEAPWYSQGYRANVVTYGIALLVQRLKEQGKVLDLKSVWDAQDVSVALRKQLLLICEVVQSRIIRSSEEKGVRNVTEWCKKPGCWDDIKSVRVAISPQLAFESITIGEARAAAKDGRKDQYIANEAEALTTVVDRGGDFWGKVLDWGQKDNRISPNDIKALSVASTIPRRIPTSWQCFRLLEIEEMYQEEVHI